MSAERLVPFDLEEARKDPSRVRRHCGRKPDHVEITPKGAVICWYDRAITSTHPEQCDTFLCLAAKPVEHRLQLAIYNGIPQIACVRMRLPSVDRLVVPTAVRLDPDGTIVITE